MPLPAPLMAEFDVGTGPFTYMRLLGDRKAVDDLTEKVDHMDPSEPDFDDPIVGHFLYTDGVRRPVFQSAEGRQYVVNEGERIDGVWLEGQLSDLGERFSSP
jgi:hypothetical protein